MFQLYKKEVNSKLYNVIKDYCQVDLTYRWYLKDKTMNVGGNDMGCRFLIQLSKLRKLSMESVENTSSFDEFKKYLHVLRPVEEDLRLLLKKVNGMMIKGISTNPQ